MHIIKLKKKTYEIEGVILSRLARVKWDSHSLDNVASLLLETDFSRASSLIEWLLDTNSKYTSNGANESVIEKEEDGKVIVDDDYGYNEEDYDTYEAYLMAKGNYEKGFVTTKENVIRVLQQWQDILNKESLPNELLIVLDDNGNVNLVPQLEHPTPELIT